MILKLMSYSQEHECGTYGGCRIVDKVRDVLFRHPGSEQALDVTYEEPNRGLLTETFILQGNAYLMNDQGKTLETFSYQPPTPG